VTDLFIEASRDLEAERLTERCAVAKVAVADLWPFLALAESLDEFDHRVALAHDHIAVKLGEDDRDLFAVTLTALKDDFMDVLALRHEEARTAGVEPVVTQATMRPGEQFWHADQQRWITVQAAADLPHQPDTRDNPYGQGANYFEDAAEEGPNTGQPGGYPQFPAGPDPVDPLNSMFPMRPSVWTVPPDATWVERPMQLQPGKHGSRLVVSNLDPDFPSIQPAGGQTTALATWAVTRVLAGAGYVGEGVQSGPGQNPGYFAGGTEGIGGDPQNGYPEDLAVEDPDDRMNELYGGVPPQQSSGSGQGGAQPYSNPSTARQGTMRDFRDATRHTAPGGGEHAPYRIEKVDGGYAVFNAKGERKNEEPKSEEGARQFQKALYKNVPGATESAKAASFHDPSDFGVRVTAQGEMPDPSGAGGAPEPPQSMTPGGVGSIAQPPLPAGPSSTSGGNAADPGGADEANKMLQQMVATVARTAADNIRQRPNDMNPSGVADEYDERTWEGGVNTRPRQPAEDRGINTPQTPRDPIPQASSTDIQRELSDDEERLRQAYRAQRFGAEQRWLSQVAISAVHHTRPILLVGV
jgi:hypothetical protein